MVMSDEYMVLGMLLVYAGASLGILGVCVHEAIEVVLEMLSDE